MKLKRRRASEVPPKIRSFINSVTSTPLENIQEPLKCFVWDFDKGDFYHWVDLFNHFDSYFEKHIKPRKDLRFEDDFLERDPPFPKEDVLQILRVMRIVLENCTNKHFLSCYEHLSSLLASSDADVVEVSLQTLATFLKKTIGKYSIRDASLSSRLLAFAQGWGCKEEGLGLTACALNSGCDSVPYELGSTLHFEFYRVAESSSHSSEYEATGGLQIIHLPHVNSRKESDLELLNTLVKEYGVPLNLRYSLFTRLRFARSFGSLTSREQYTCIRLYAFMVVVQANTDADDLVSFFNTEPEFTNELVSLLSFEYSVSEKIRILSLRSLVALSQDRSRQPTVLAAVTSDGQRGILSSLMQKAIDSVSNGSSKWSVLFAEALLSLVTVLVSSSSGCSAMREAGFIPTLLPLLKDTDPQHLHLVGTAVHVLEAFMDYSNPAAALFRDLGGLDDTINRLKVEVSVIENGLQQPSGSSDGSMSTDGAVGNLGTSSVLDDILPLYSESLLAYHRRLLMKALLRAISLGTYAPGSTDRIYGSEESLLPQCLCIIFRRAKDFGGGVFSLAATVMSDLIHKDPTCFSVLDAAGLPTAFIDAIMDGVLCSADAITCIPQCLDALCLNNTGLQAVKDRNALSCFVKIFTSKGYLRALAGDTPGSLSSGLDELMRHATSLRGPGVDMLIEILNTISKLGSADEASASPVESLTCPAPVPMETDLDAKNLSSVESELPKSEITDPTDLPSDPTLVNLESYLPDCISNACRLLETILQNSDACRLFIEKRGIETILQMFSLPLLPVSVSVGQSVSSAFKNFSAQHSASLARAVCSFLREHLDTTIEVLDSIEGTPVANLESAKQIKVMRCLSTLEGILSLSNSLLKGTTTVISELGTGDADVLKDIGKIYREILWQISLSSDSKVEPKQNAEVETENVDAASSSAIGRESDDDTGIPMVRYMNPVSIRSSSQSQWAGERDFLTVIRSGEGLSRRNRHGLTRIRGGRTGRHLDSFNMDSEVSANVHEPSAALLERKKKSPDVLASDILFKLSGTMRSFYTALVKGFSSPNRRRADSGSMSSVAKNIGTALSKIFLEALNFSGYSSPAGLEMSLSVKCRYLGKVVHDMAALTFDSRRRICYTAMVNNFYVSGAFKELLTTFEATSQLLWSLPCPFPTFGVDSGKAGEGSKLEHSSWLLETLQSYCRLVEYFVNSSLLLSPTSPSQAQLLVQPVAVGLSIGLFPVPRDPEVFVRMLQSQVLDVILPVWNHPMFPQCSTSFITSILSLVTHIYSGVGDLKRNRSGVTGSSNQRIAPPPDEATIATIVEMGFSRERAEEALRRVESNSVEMAMDWLCTHAEDPVQEDDELARALALSLGSSTETSKADNIEKSADVIGEEGQMKAPPVDDILGASMKLFHSGDSLAFPLTDLLATLCNRNKGEDRLKVASYLIQQLKLCSSDMSKDGSAVSSISHILALLLSEDTDAREIAAQNGIVSVATDILKNLIGNQLGSDILITKSTSALLLILDNLLQSRPRISADKAGVASTEPLSDLSVEVAPVEASGPDMEKKLTSDVCEEKWVSSFQKIFGKSTGYLSMDECHAVLQIACDMLKQQVPAVIMQAVLQLCARLTKTHVLALEYLASGGMAALFDLPRSCFFPGYDTLASAIIRHLLEDPQTLQTAMELEIRQTLSGGRHAGRIPTRMFLTSMAPVISRDPVIFTKAAAAVCQVESSAGRTVVVLSKEKEKEKDRSKVSGAEVGLSSEAVRIPEMKSQDGPGKGSKGHRKIAANLYQVIDPLLDIILQYPCTKSQEDHISCQAVMDVDEPSTNVKGKSKIDEANKGDADILPERSAALAKVIFVLKLLSDILLMYAHAIGVVLRRDSETCQLRGSSQPDASGQGGVVYHVLNKLLPLSSDKFSGLGDLRTKLSEKASWFLVVLCGRSSEGRRRVISELLKALSLYSNMGSNSHQSSLLPDRKVLAFVDLVYSVLSKNTSSTSLSMSGYSPDIARGMIDGGIVPCLSNILQVIDLDHPDAPKIANLILKALESLTRAANASEQSYRSDVQNKKKSNCSQERPDDQTINASTNDTIHNDVSQISEQETRNVGVVEPNPCEGAGRESNHVTDMDGSANLDGRPEGEGAPDANPAVELGMEFTGDEMEEGDIMHNNNRISMEFHVENQADEDVGDDDDDMGGEGEEEDEDEDGEDEDEDIAEDGTALMSLADTDVDDHEDAGFGDEFNDEMIDDEDDDYHENRVVEVRWREALDGFHHLQVGPGSGLIDVPSEPFEGVNVDDLFGLRRTLGIERRRQTTRSFERNNTDGGLQHPLLLRPPQSGEAPLLSSGGNVARDSESLSGAGADVSHFYMFDTPPFIYDFGPGSLFGDRSGGTAPPPLTDYSVGMDSSQLGGRRGPGDGRWADDGQPQAANQAPAIAQAVEEVFVSVLRGANVTDTAVGRQSPSMRLPEQQLDGGQNSDHLGLEEDLSHGQSEEVQLGNGEPEPQQTNSQNTVSAQGPVITHTVTEVSAALERELLASNPVRDSMESANGNDPPSDLMRTERDPSLSSVDPEHNILREGDLGQLDNQQDAQRLARLADVSSGSDFQPNNDVNNPGVALFNQVEHHPSACASPDIEMNGADAEPVQTNELQAASESNEPVSDQNISINGSSMDADQVGANVEPSRSNAIDPTFLEALPEELRAEVLASQQSQSVQPPTYTPPSVEDIDPEFLAALPPDIQAEVLAQQRVQRMAQQSEGQPVDMDNASIIATLPADLREEVLLTSSEAVLSALPSPLLAEAQMLRDRAMSHYQARSLFGSSHRLTHRRNGLGFDRQSVMDRGVGVSIGRRTGPSLSDAFKVKEVEGEPLLDGNAVKALIRLLRLAQPLGKGLLQRLLLNLCAHSLTRATLVHHLLEMIKPEAEGIAGSLSMVNPQRLYGCPTNVVYGQSQLLDGLPPLVLRRVLEILNYLATNHSAVANILFYCEPSPLPESSQKFAETKKGKEKVGENEVPPNSLMESEEGSIPIILLLKLLNRPLFQRSIAHVEQVMSLLQVVVYTAVSRLESPSLPEQVTDDPQGLSVKASDEIQRDVTLLETETSNQVNKVETEKPSISERKEGHKIFDFFTQLPRSDLRNLSRLLGCEGLSDKVYMLAGEVVKKLASVTASHREFFIQELSVLAQDLSNDAVEELATLHNTRMMGLGVGAMAGATILRVLQALSSLVSQSVDNAVCQGSNDEEEQAILLKLNSALEPLWLELSYCISTTESELGQSTLSPIMASINAGDGAAGSSISSPPLPPGTQRLLPFIESFFVLCEKLQSSNSFLQQEQTNVTAQEVKESADSSSSVPTKCGGDSQRRSDSAFLFSKFADKHRRLLNAFIRQNPGLLEKSLSMMLKAPRLIDFDNKRAYFRSRIRQQHEQHLAGPLRISVRRAYVLEDSYNQLRMRSNQDLKGRLNVQFQGEEGIDAGGLTREWYQLLSRVIFDKGALLFTTVGNNATFQPNPNSVYQTEHLSYFKFVGRVVAKALFDGQLLDVYFTRSFYKHILGVKVTYHDIEAVDPDYYKNLKWLLENDVNDILGLTFSMDADEEKLILYEKTQVTDYELKPGGRNIRVTEETKHEYVDLVADHILTNAIRPQINSFLEGFNELVPRELISIFNDKELELLISGLPEIDLDDLKANTEYTGYTVASNVIQWFWEVASNFSKEDMARFLQFVTGTSKVPLEGFKALQGISGPQRFQIHKAYGAPERLPSAHTCFNQLDLPEYSTKEQLCERLLLAIHEASEGFGFG